MFSFYKIIFLITLPFIFSACSQKITVKSLVPAQVGDRDIKNVSIVKFQNDTILLRDFINSQMSHVVFNGKNYFTIVNRDDVKMILKEQKLKNSGLINNNNESSYGLRDISSIISGKVNSKTYKKYDFFEKRIDYNTCVKYKIEKNKKKYCTNYRTYKVLCYGYDYSISANIKITRVSNSDVIFSRTFIRTATQQNCQDQKTHILPAQSIYESLASSIAKEFVALISPSYRYVSLELIDDEDIDYTKSQKRMLKNALKLIELKDLTTANMLLEKLVSSTQSKSATALYDLGVTYEYLGKLNQALKVYKKAKMITLMNDMNKNIIQAVNRIKKAIKNKAIASKQID